MTLPSRKPNLFIIGSMKSGTTSLHEYLDTHPQISMSTQKEPAFFAEEFTLSRGQEWYLSLFSQSDQYRYLGESSTQYTRLPLFKDIPERIHDFNPDTHLIDMMRDPYERVISHYWNTVRVRRILIGKGESPCLLNPITQDPEEYLATSNYAMQLAPHIRYFGRDSLYYLRFKALVESPQREVNEIYEQLGLPSHPLGKQLPFAHNQTPKYATSVAALLKRIPHSKSSKLLSPRIPNSFRRYAKRRTHHPIDHERPQAARAAQKASTSAFQDHKMAELSTLLLRSGEIFQNGGITLICSEPRRTST